MAKRRGTPPRVFSELHILKDFKCCDLKLRILQGLEACFAKLRIVKGIVASDEWMEEAWPVFREP